MDEQQAFLETLKAEREIAKVIRLAARASDRKDLSAQRACYHDDAIDNHGMFNGPVDDFFAWLQPHHENYDMFLHFMGTPSIEVEGTRAFSETYCLAVTQLKVHTLYTLTAAPMTMIGCRFLDEFEQRDGAWKILKRTVVFEWSKTDYAAPAKVPPTPGGPMVPPFRSPEDFVYKLGDGILMKPPAAARA
ncbi:nuclear transport factor 2 family protein [Nocardia sp. NPDC050378]|uniref:nuclear transport factor 2 family protein n=1 Tax=Nocardia sp. NPDC050378 TaxID=3155400 RepID=UPI0033C7BCB6